MTLADKLKVILLSWAVWFLGLFTFHVAAHNFWLGLSLVGLVLGCLSFQMHFMSRVTFGRGTLS